MKLTLVSLCEMNLSHSTQEANSNQPFVQTLSWEWVVVWSAPLRATSSHSYIWCKEIFGCFVRSMYPFLTLKEKRKFFWDCLRNVGEAKWRISPFLTAWALGSVQKKTWLCHRSKPFAKKGNVCVLIACLSGHGLFRSPSAGEVLMGGPDSWRPAVVTWSRKRKGRSTPSCIGSVRHPSHPDID